MKKAVTLGLSLALAAGLAAPAMAAELEIVPISAPLESYVRKLVLNGAELDTAGLPFSNGIPMRLLAESDYGSAYWAPEENSSYFYLEGGTIMVNYATGEVSVEGEVVDAQMDIIDGVTFLQPEGTVNALEGYSIVQSDEGAWEITTPNGGELTKLAREIMAAAGVGAGMKTPAADMEQYHGISADNFTEVVGFFPMMISPDTVVVGKLAEGKADTAQEQFEAFRQVQADTFSWYLSQNLPKVENAQFVVNGDYFLFIIGGEYANPETPEEVVPDDAPTAAAGVEIFNAWVEAQTAE